MTRGRALGPLAILTGAVLLWFWMRPNEELADLDAPLADTALPDVEAASAAPPPALRPLADALARVRARAALRARPPGGLGQPAQATRRFERHGDEAAGDSGPEASAALAAEAAHGGVPPPEGERAPVTFATDRDGIRSAMELAKEEVRDCYDEWLKVNPTLAGKLVITYRIVPDEADPRVGHVVDAAVREGGLGNAFLDGCVLASLGALEFEAPAEGGVMNVTYPLLFSNDDDQPVE